VAVASAVQNEDGDSSRGTITNGMWAVKTKLQRNPPVLKWGCRLTQVDPHNGCKTDVVVVVLFPTYSRPRPKHNHWNNRSKIFSCQIPLSSYKQLECGPMPNVMAALPNIGGALCSTPHSLDGAQYWSAVQ